MARDLDPDDFYKPGETLCDYKKRQLGRIVQFFVDGMSTFIQKEDLLCKLLREKQEAI